MILEHATASPWVGHATMSTASTEVPPQLRMELSKQTCMLPALATTRTIFSPPRRKARFPGRPANLLRAESYGKTSLRSARPSLHLYCPQPEDTTSTLHCTTG